MHVVYRINRIHSPIISNKCPYEKLCFDVSDIGSLRIFRCLCFTSTFENNRSKLDSRARKRIFLVLKQR